MENIDGKTKTVKRKPTPRIWVVLNKARKSFNAQLTKSNDVKLQCLQKYSADIGDQQKFYNDFMEQVGKLTDSKRFCDAADAKRVSPEILATHIVFLGSSTMNKVFKFGLDPIEADLDLYKEAFMPESAQKYAGQE